MGKKGWAEAGQDQDRGVFGATPVRRHSSDQQQQQHRQQPDGVADAPRSLGQDEDWTQV